MIPDSIAIDFKTATPEERRKAGDILMANYKSLVDEMVAKADYASTMGYWNAPGPMAMEILSVSAFIEKFSDPQPDVPKGAPMTEDLLKPRFKVIAIYPYSPFEVVKDSVVNLYPHLFKPLQWWEDRKIEDMPKYVRHINTGEVVEVKRHRPESGCFIINFTTIEQYSYYSPATEAEYLTKK